MRGLTTDLTRQELRPYFLWDEDVSIAELHQILAGPDGPRRDQLLAKMLREARDLDVWHFVRPVEVARACSTGSGGGSAGAMHSGRS